MHAEKAALRHLTLPQQSSCSGLVGGCVAAWGKKSGGMQVVSQCVKRCCGGCTNCTKNKLPLCVLSYSDFAQQWWCDCSLVFAYVYVGKGGRCFCSSDCEGVSSTRERERVTVFSFGDVLAFVSRSKAAGEMVAVQTSACLVSRLGTTGLPRCSQQRTVAADRVLQNLHLLSWPDCTWPVLKAILVLGCASRKSI